MNVYLTLFYTSKNKDYEKNLYKYLNNYKNIGIKDIFLYTEDCLPKDFKWLYQDFFEKYQRGYGYWAWKPLVIYDAMKKINDGDMILYHDVGRSCYSFDIKSNITDLAEKIKKEYKGIGIARGGFKHKEFCKRDVFYYMGCDEENCWNLNQLSATWSFWEKSDIPKKFIMDWIKWCFHDKLIITDEGNKSGLSNFPEFKDNRHDQAILTNLLYLYNKNNLKIEALTSDGWEKDINNYIRKYTNKNNIINEKKLNSKIREDTTVVTGHFHENLKWLSQKNHMFKSIVVCDKIGADPIPEEIKLELDCKSCPIIENKGSDAGHYLNYIINNYDNLSERTAFIHGHENAWHYKNPLNILDAILVARTDKYGFISLNIKHHPGYDYSEDRNYNRIKDRRKIMILMEKYWPDYFQEYLGDIPEKFSHDCCPQFVVTKERVLKHPKKAYQKWFDLYNVWQEKENDTEWSKDNTHSLYALLFEFIWHIIFGEPAIVPENQRDLGYFKERFL
jgi:hypothetical protein